ncbi:MAG TPA: SusC/RagA family TonB-linked outer membrane protein [Gemmatimonadaceae bacterium]|jgi:TonB-linked SusC/RagA family outer membrane protein|nr:SusC/RagA family TonB-linked outer membrane protein [Gemmatimonadaceae bacterium]
MTKARLFSSRRTISTFLFLTSLGAASLVRAQAGTVSGTVIDAKSGLPLPDVTVAVVGTQLGARSGTRGEFRLTTVPGATARLRATRIGYQQSQLDARVGGPAVRIEMIELAVKLDAVVVTGTAGEVQKRTLGNAVGRVEVTNSVALVGRPTKLQDVLSSSVPGVRIMRASGGVGTGGTTRIRGSGSLSLSNEPLIYIDGVRSNNQAAVRSFGFNGQESPSRLNDLNPEDIESIEVLKGPSAATIYGTEASNGVIQIITKRGRSGRPTIEAHADAGVAFLYDPVNRYPANFYLRRGGDYRNPADIKEFNVQKFLAQRGFPEIFSTGTPWGGGGSVSGGTDQLRYFFGGDYKREEGAVDYNWQNKFSSRANVSYASNDAKFTADLSLGAIRARTRGASGTQPITTSILWACNFPWCEPTGPDTTKTGWNGPGHGFQFYRPEDYYSVEGFDIVDRATFSLQLNHRPFTWLRHRLTVGPDITNNKSSQLVFRDPTGYNPFFAASLGQKQAMALRSTFFTADYGANADWNVTPGFVATTSAGAQYYYKQFDQQVSTGNEFPVPGPGDVGSGARRDASESFQENKTFGVYGQEQLAWKNRLFVTAAIRADGNSAFGANFDAAYYPKFSASWVISEEPFLANSKILSQLKLRGAWGRAGLQPDVFSAIQTYGAAVGSQGLGGVTPRNFGNADLKPEIGEESEFGFDAGLFDQRLGIEFTFYNKDINDAIISAPLRPSRGFPGVQFLNIGKTRNRGIELALDGSVLSTPRWGLDLRGTIATNDSKIVSLGGVPSTFVGSSYIQQFNVEKFAPSAFFYKKVVSATLVPDTTRSGGTVLFILPRATNVMCEGGTDLGRGDGSVVPCATAPRLYAGRPTPSYNGSLSGTLRFGSRTRLLALVDYVGGHHAIVGDVGAQHTFFRNSRSSIAGDDPVVQGYRNDPNGPGVAGLFDAGFARLRTVSLTYDLPNSITRTMSATRGSVTFAGENLLFLWRAQEAAYGAKWVDPELLPNRATDVTGNFGYTQESWPQLMRFRTTVRFTF